MHFSYHVIAASALALLAACTSSSAGSKASLTPSGPTMSIDEDMYDAPAMAQKMCKEIGCTDAVLISRDAAARKSTHQCGK